MLPPTIKRAFCALLIAITATSTVSSQCCDFDTSICSWNYGFWQTTPSAYPDTLYYPYFYSTHPSSGSNFMFLQDQSGTAISVTTISVPSEGTVISFDYFFSGPAPENYDYFEVYFTNDDILFTTLLATFQTMDSNWRHIDVICDITNLYCCGGTSELPCQGRLQIIANVNSANPAALFAIDNIGTCGSAPPTPASCCEFESNICGLSLSNWYWSATTTSPYYIPPNSGRYLWTDVVSAQAMSYTQYNVNPYTLFSMSYYISSPSVFLYVYFQPYVGSTSLLTDVGYTSGVWHTVQTDCATCCGGGACDGQILLQVVGTPGSFVVAVDNTDRDGACHGSIPCCYFDDISLCGYTSDVDLGYQWYSSSARLPSISPPYTGSAYAYFETVSFVGSALSVRLRSSPISIAESTAFRGSFYVRIADAATTTSALFVNFYNEGLGITTQLDYLKDTEGVWEIGEFSCDTLHGNCCQGYPTCNGYIEFDAVVEANGGSVMYAIDAFEITGTCGAFPGQSQKLRFTPVKSSHPVAFNGTNN